jgi:hypothetical protein
VNTDALFAGVHGAACSQALRATDLFCLALKAGTSGIQAVAISIEVCVSAHRLVERPSLNMRFKLTVGFL